MCGCLREYIWMPLKNKIKKCCCLECAGLWAPYKKKKKKKCLTQNISNTFWHPHFSFVSHKYDCPKQVCTKACNTVQNVARVFSVQKVKPLHTSLMIKQSKDWKCCWCLGCPQCRHKESLQSLDYHWGTYPWDNKICVRFLFLLYRSDNCMTGG